ISVGESGRIDTSPNGKKWTKRAGRLGLPTLRGITFGRGRFVAVGNSGTILQSDSVAPYTRPVSLSQPTVRNGAVEFLFTGTPGQNYEIEGSADLVHWSPLGTIFCTTIPTLCHLDDQIEGHYFYRLVPLLTVSQ